MIALEFPPINEILRWKDVAPSFNKIAIIATGLSLVAGISRAADKVDFEKDVAPILAEHCIGCHGEEKQKGKLRLDGKADAFKGGKSGHAEIGRAHV